MDNENSDKKKDSEKIKFFISTPLRSAHKLKKQLYADDTFFRQTSFAWLGIEDSKKLFFYNVSVEIQKACVEVMRTSALFDDTNGGNDYQKHEDSDTERLVKNSIVDRQNSLIRKLTELLSLVINFTRTTNDVEYRIFHSAQNLNRFLNQQKSFYEVFQVNNNNTQSSVLDYKDKVDKDIVLNDGHLPWFIDKDHLKNLRPSVFRGWMAFYKEAIDICNNDEKALLGNSYERYSNYSQNVHPTMTSHDYLNEDGWEMIFANFGYISLLSMHTISRSYELLGMKDEDGIKKILGENFEKSDATSMMSLFLKKFGIGDIVFVHSNDLAEIMESRIGKFGFTVYKIKYLSNPPLPEYPEDWVEGRRLTLIFEPEQIRPYFANSISVNSDFPDEVKSVLKMMLSEKDEVVTDLMKKTLINLHKEGILVKMLEMSNVIIPLKKFK
jgi:hypothetical protein